MSTYEPAGSLMFPRIAALIEAACCQKSSWVHSRVLIVGPTWAWLRPIGSSGCTEGSSGTRSSCENTGDRGPMRLFLAPPLGPALL